MKKVKQLLNKPVKSLLKDENNNIYATDKEGKSVFENL